jgi:hypothetical protein
MIPGDANGDAQVDVGDLGILAANYGITNGATWNLGDFNNDEVIDVGDLGILAAHYGEGITRPTNFDANYSQAFGTTVPKEKSHVNDMVDGEIDHLSCSGLGLVLIPGWVVIGMLIKLS